jgi:hypothetical protein
VKMDFSPAPAAVACCGLAGEEALMGEEDMFAGVFAGLAGEDCQQG